MFTSILEFLAYIVIWMISTLGYFGVFVAMVLESAGIPLPSEIIMPFSGYLVYRGEFNFWLVSVVGALGNVVGSIIAYYVGKVGGRPLVEKYGKYVLLSKHDLNVAEKWFQKYGRSAVFFSRLLPVVRTFISFPAGFSGMNLKAFSLYTFLGALPFTMALTYLGYALGEKWTTIHSYFEEYDILTGLVIIAVIIWYVKRHLKNLKKI